MAGARWAIDIDRDDIAEAVLVEEPELPLRPGEVEVRHSCSVAVPVSVTVPFLLRVILKSGPPVGNGAEQFEAPDRMLLSSEK